MTGYSRMTVPPTEYLDEAGAVIPYGSRWPAGGPPDDSYSRVSTPQRFLPLQAVARQLIAAGAFHQFAFPACGCDACDEGADAQLDQLEETVFAVVNGDYREWAAGAAVGFSLRFNSGSRSGEGSARDIDPERLAAGLSILPRTGASWLPWPHRR